MSTYQMIKEKYINLGKEEGIEKGIEKEILEGIEKAVINGHKNGIDIPMLANIAQMSESDVLNILKKAGLA